MDTWARTYYGIGDRWRRCRRELFESRCAHGLLRALDSSCEGCSRVVRLECAWITCLLEEEFAEELLSDLTVGFKKGWTDQASPIGTHTKKHC